MDTTNVLLAGALPRNQRSYKYYPWWPAHVITSQRQPVLVQIFVQATVATPIGFKVTFLQ